jgi:hypothetical protein
VRRSNSSNSCLVCARGVARSEKSLAKLSDVFNGGGDIGLLPNWMETLAKIVTKSWSQFTFVVLVVTLIESTCSSELIDGDCDSSIPSKVGCIGAF